MRVGEAMVGEVGADHSSGVVETITMVRPVR
jgi:hypothetical protein